MEIVEGNNYPRLTSKLLALSASNDYEEAKKEWRITGRVWRDTAYGSTHELVVNHPSGHAGACLCGHPIVYHFEIENTVTNILEIVGSTCINNWMVLRHMSEVLKIPKDTITEEKIEEWKKMTVEGLIRNAFWQSEEGEDFKETFEELKELDLRINVRLDSTGKTYFDEKVAEVRPITKIRKTSKGTYGSSDYEMASIVWRWNHPDNPKNQQSTRGWPNDKLQNDLALFDALIDVHLPKIRKEDEYIESRQNFLKELSLKNADKLRNEFTESAENVKFMEACNYFGFPIWKSTDGANMWQKSFLSDMRRRFIRGGEPTENQAKKLISILLRDEIAATDKQKTFLKSLEYDGDVEKISKSDASKMIDKLLTEKRRK